MTEEEFLITLSEFLIHYGELLPVDVINDIIVDRIFDIQEDDDVEV